MKSEIELRTVTDSRLGQLKAILFLMQTDMDQFQTEVNRTYELLKIGEKTDLSQQIEKIMDDPLSTIFEISSDFDDKAKFLVDKLVISFLKHKSKYISHAYRSLTFFNDLHYTIILKEDSLVSRNAMFEFFEAYDLLNLSVKFPVYFQYVPIELIDRMSVCEEIIRPEN
jgi:hypothetical protein